MQSYFKKDKDGIIFTGVYMKVFIPISFFDMKVAVDVGGDTVEVIGIFNIAVYSDREGTKGGKIDTLKLPSVINIYPPGGDFKEEELELIPGTGVERYRIYDFYQGDKFTDLNYIKKSSGAERFLNILEAGKIPHTIPYDRIFDLWTRNMEMNGVSMPYVSSSSRETIVAELSRYKKDPRTRFGIVAGKDTKLSLYDYLMVNARTLSKYSSTFASISFEDFDTMVTNGANTAKSSKEQNTSPIEEIIKF